MPSERTDASAETQSDPAQTAGPSDLFLCLTEPRNSQWVINNRDGCNAAFSKELGVENWDKVNFSNDPEFTRI